MDDEQQAGRVVRLVSVAAAIIFRNPAYHPGNAFGNRTPSCRECNGIRVTRGLGTCPGIIVSGEDKMFQYHVIIVSASSQADLVSAPEAFVCDRAIQPYEPTEQPWITYR